MSVWSIIIAAAIFILPSLLPGKKKAGKKTVSAAPVPPMDVPEEDDSVSGSGWENIFAEDEESVETDDLGQPFFSYETVGQSKDEPVASKDDNKVASKSDVADSIPVTLSDEAFDLRRAIIYQTILQRVSA